MAIEKVREYFKQFGRQEEIMEFDVSSATVELAAQALNCEGKRIAKTLSFTLGEQTILIVAAGDAKIDNKKYRNHFGVKAKMLPSEVVLEKIGHEIGGVCPFGINVGVEVFLDQSLKRFDTVFPACGSSNSAIELNLPDLEEFANAQGWVDVCKGYELEEVQEPQLIQEVNV